MKDIQFDPNGGKLWVRMDMKGMYIITYVYYLMENDHKTPLSSPFKIGNNTDTKEDYFQIINDLNSTDPLTSFDNREVYVSYVITDIKGDSGYRVRTTILQGDDFKTAITLDFEEKTGNTGTPGIKEEVTEINLKKK